MAQENGPRVRVKRRRGHVLDSEQLSNTDKRMLLELSCGIDEDDLKHTSPVGNKAVSTNSNYLIRLRQLAEAYDGEFHKISTQELKQLLGEFADGSHPYVSDDGYAEGTMVQFQSAAKAFINHHSLNIDPDDIPVSSTERGSQAVDERDMLDNSDIEAMRDVIENARDECLFELLLNTGQRIRAIQTLRVKDVDVNEGVYWLNTDDIGLKGADKVGKKRPLLGAVGAVKTWLEYHPTGKPDDYLLTPRVDNNKATPGEMLAGSTIRARLKKIADEAGVTKPVNPHNFRHSFVTMCKRDYNMDDSTVKFLIGHASDSTVMETTYQHLTDDDYIADAEIATGRREPEEATTVGRTQCPNPDCLNELEPTDKACNSCGTVIAPDAQTAKDTIEDSLKDSYKQTPPGDADTMEKLDTLDELLDDPEVKAALLEKLGEE
ncbi:MAG: integrase/recombinase XerD [Haloarculaceae archaeon]|jgi:integrase/recombinase XerD